MVVCHAAVRRRWIRWHVLALVVHGRRRVLLWRRRVHRIIHQGWIIGLRRQVRGIHHATAWVRERHHVSAWWRMRIRVVTLGVLGVGRVVAVHVSVVSIVVGVFLVLALHLDVLFVVKFVILSDFSLHRRRALVVARRLHGA